MDPANLKSEYDNIIARRKFDMATVSQSVRIKCYDMSIDWKTKTFVEDTFPSVLFNLDSVETDRWLFWKTKQIIFTLTGPRVDVNACADSIQDSIRKYQAKMLG